MNLEFEQRQLRDWKFIRNSDSPYYSKLFNIIISFDNIEIELADRRFHIEQNTLIFLGPQKLFSIKQQGAETVYILSFSASFYEKSYTDSLLLHSDLFFDTNQPLKVSAMNRNAIEFSRQLIKRIKDAEQRDKKTLHLIAHNCIESLLLNGLNDIKPNGYEGAKAADFSQQGTVNIFTALVHRYYKEQTGVKFYADKLNITPRKLTNSCISVLNRSAKAEIKQIMLKEALRYLKNTTLSISQIAYEVGFSDESNFRHFIKKHTGRIPLAHRKKASLN